MITSLLDNDHYALLMSNAIHIAGDDHWQVKYEFRNRTFAVPLASRLSLPLLRDHIEQIRELQITPKEIAWLTSLGYFSDAWLADLIDYRLPEVEIGQDNGHLVMRYEGAWSETILWESILLALVNETYYSRFGPYTSEGHQRLEEKIDYLKERGTIHFSEFGTRRRFSHDWQHIVVHEMKSRVPEFMVGTSNAALAMELDLTPIGTMAHQLFMVYTAIQMQPYWSDQGAIPYDGQGDAIAEGIHRVLGVWKGAYRGSSPLMTVLPDTYGTDAFIKRALPKDMEGFDRFRQDSGDAIERSTQLLRYAASLGKMRPMIIPSDSLDVRRMSVIEDHLFATALNMRVRDIDPYLSFGWGTNLTNDLGYEPLAIVIKPSAVLAGKDWLPCVKLSDDAQKITGGDEQVAPYLKCLAKDFV